MSCNKENQEINSTQSMKRTPFDSANVSQARNQFAKNLAQIISKKEVQDFLLQEAKLQKNLDNEILYMASYNKPISIGKTFANYLSEADKNAVMLRDGTNPTFQFHTSIIQDFRRNFLVLPPAWPFYLWQRVCLGTKNYDYKSHNNGVALTTVFWNPTENGDKMKYIWYEVDNPDFTFDLTTSLSTKIKNITVTVGGTIKYNPKDDFLGEAIVDYCDLANGGGTAYTTGSLFFNVSQ